jgi:hypothetical protein
VRPAIVTSVTDVVVRGDLLDRAIVITLPTVAESARVAEDALWARFAAAAPGILGALLDAVASALARERDTALDRLPRMADWARWVTAAEPGLGWPHGQILDAYRAMRATTVETSLDGDPLAVAIRRLSLPWIGTSADLLVLLAPSGRAPRGWPESPRAMSAALRRLAPYLRRIGIDVAMYRESGSGSRRLVRLDHLPADDDETGAVSSRPSHPSQEPNIRADIGDGRDDRPSHRPSPDQADDRDGSDHGDGRDGLPGLSSHGGPDGI